MTEIVPDTITLIRHCRVVLFRDGEPVKCFGTFNEAARYANKSYGFIQHLVRNGHTFKMDDIDYTMKNYKDVIEYDGVKYKSKERFYAANKDLCKGKKIIVKNNF